MTREFAINILEQYREKPTLINEIETVEEAVWLDEALEMAIKALEQESKTGNDLDMKLKLMEANINGYTQGLKDASNTEQEPKTGHWIEHPEIETSIPEYLMFYECSECGDKQCFCKSDIHKKRFCGNCGCRMVEPQESEGKE